MRRLELSLAAVALTVLLAASGCGGSGGVGLRAAEAAFARQHVPFQTDWRRSQQNPNLTRPSQSDVASLLPERLMPHVRGVAWWVNDATFHARMVFVLDSSSEARRLVAWEEKGVERGTVDVGKNVVLLARNAVYFGDDVPAVHRAMAKLRG